MQSNDDNKNRGTHGDSSFMLGGLPSSSENPPASAVGSVTRIPIFITLYMRKRSEIGWKPLKISMYH